MYKIKVKIKGLKNISNLGKFVRKENIKLILFGEYHEFINQIHIQREIIKKTKPNFFLYEMLEDKKILTETEAKSFLKNPSNKNFSVVSTYGNLKPIIKLARSFNLPIIGGDVKNMGVKKDWRKKKYTDKEANKIIQKRELQQAKIINEYTSKGLVFALVGNYHLRKDSLVLNKLKVKKFILVKPAFKWTEKFNYPKKFKNSEISYTIQLVNKNNLD